MGGAINKKQGQKCFEGNRGGTKVPSVRARSEERDPSPKNISVPVGYISITTGKIIGRRLVFVYRYCPTWSRKSVFT